MSIGGLPTIGFLVETPIETDKRLYGAQISFLSLLTELIKRGVRACVVVSESWELTHRLEAMGVPVLECPIWEFFDSLDGFFAPAHDPDWQRKQAELSEPRIAQFFRAEGVDLVHMNTRFAGLIGARVARAMGLPYVYHVREFLDDDFGLAFADTVEADVLLNDASALIAVSESVRSRLQNEYPRAHVEVVYNGVEQPTPAAARFPILSTPVPRLAIAGRVAPHKGQIEAVRAIQELRERGISVTLDIIGHLVNEPSQYAVALKTYVVEQALDDCVSFIPFTPRLGELLRNYDIGLVCSKKEAFGRVTVDYMLAGMLCIGADTGGTSEIIHHGTNGLLYRHSDPTDLANQIVEAVTSIGSSRRMAARGLSMAQSRFNVAKNAEEILSLYRKILVAS